MLIITRNGLTLEHVWMYETEPLKSIYFRVNTLLDGTLDKDRLINKGELKYIYFKSAILPSNPFSGIFDKEEYDSKIHELSGLPSDWRPDSKVIEAIIFMRDYQKDKMPTTKAMFNLMLVLHSLSKYYSTKTKTLSVVESKIEQATVELENSTNEEQTSILIRIESLNKMAGDILKEALNAVPSIEAASKNLDVLYEQLRGDMSKQLDSAKGSVKLGQREDPDNS